MLKKWMAFTALGIAMSAQAQTNLVIYGTVDTGLIKETGSHIRMDENATNLIGIRGSESLANGVKATFQLERQFQLPDGTRKEIESLDDSLSIALGNRGKSIEWIGAANVGLEGAWGSVRLGRVNEMSSEYFGELDPFLQVSTGAALAKYNLLRSEQLSNTIRYDSPELAGFAFGATYTLSADEHNKPADVNSDIYNAGFGGSLRYNNGAVSIMSNYNRQADSGKSFVWNIGGAYTVGDWRFSAGYQGSQLKNLSSITDLDFGFETPINQKEYLLGIQYHIGRGTINASYNRASVDKTAHDGDVNKYALGYTYDLSKRTQLYGMVSYTDSDNCFVGSIYNNNGAERESVTGIQAGIMHNF